MHRTYHKHTNSINWHSAELPGAKNGFLDLATHKKQVKYSTLELHKLQ